MAEEQKEHKGKGRKHLHEIRTVQAHDGSFVHHHTYKTKKDDAHTEPERENVATSTTPEEAGEHVAEQMGMNDQGGGDPGAAPAPDPGAAAAPAAAAPAGM